VADGGSSVFDTTGFCGDETFWREAISSTFLLAVRKNSVHYVIVDEVHAFIVDIHSL